MKNFHPGRVVLGIAFCASLFFAGMTTNIKGRHSVAEAEPAILYKPDMKMRQDEHIGKISDHYAIDKAQCQALANDVMAMDKLDLAYAMEK